MRLIDADAFDRRLAAAEFDAALNNADDENRPFRKQAMYYSTESFRDVMSYQPTVEAISAAWLEEQRQGMEDAEQDFPEQAIRYVLWLWRHKETQDG